MTRLLKDHVEPNLYLSGHPSTPHTATCQSSIYSDEKELLAKYSAFSVIRTSIIRILDYPDTFAAYAHSKRPVHARAEYSVASLCGRSMHANLCDGDK